MFPDDKMAPQEFSPRKTTFHDAGNRCGIDKPLDTSLNAQETH